MAIIELEAKVEGKAELQAGAGRILGLQALLVGVSKQTVGKPPPPPPSPEKK